MTKLVSLLAGRADIWRGSEMAAASSAVEPTGYPGLDELLPGGGWPRGALIEILPASVGSGAMELLLPVLARLSGRSRWIVLVDPPFRPFAPGFAGHGVELARLLWVRTRKQGGAECLWAIEQAMRSGACSMVLGWPGIAMTRDAVRRLQLAAEAAEALGCLFLSPAEAGQLSAAALRLGVRRQGSDMEVEVLKRRGGWALPPRRLCCRSPVDYSGGGGAAPTGRADVEHAAGETPGDGRWPAEASGMETDVPSAG